MVLTAMISSTILDLPHYRQHAIDVIIRRGMFPLAMEYLPANPADAIDVSINMVERAHIYVGIIAHRYGEIPDSPKNPERLSLTELEYLHAVKRNIPCYIFIMPDDLRNDLKAVEPNNTEKIQKLLRFKENLTRNHVVGFFQTQQEFREALLTAIPQPREDMMEDAKPTLTTIPIPPAPYIPHPYTLLQTRKLIGRKNEFKLLDTWFEKKSADIQGRHVFALIAIGGMGKSALAWQWFTEKTLTANRSLVGKMWWSFYESDSGFDSLIENLLAYIGQYSRTEILDMSRTEREDLVINLLNTKPLLLVLDGLERILVAYARLNASHLTDEALNKLFIESEPSDKKSHHLRRFTDPRISYFFRRLLTVEKSSILITSRLFPSDLETVTEKPFPCIFRHDLEGLDGLDSIALWHSLGVKGEGFELLPMFDTFGHHPLLIQSLASRVARDRLYPGNFNMWKQSNPEFNPFVLPLAKARTHVLYFALLGLEEDTRFALNTIAAFHIPADYGTLLKILVSQSGRVKSETRLDSVLAELEDRGLIGWDKSSNRYDMHPVVRGVAWVDLEQKNQQEVYEIMLSHFEAMPPQYQSYTLSLSEMEQTVELYITLVGLGKYDEAYMVFRTRIQNAIENSRQNEILELLEMLFPSGMDRLPKLTNVVDQEEVLCMTSDLYSQSGQLMRSIALSTTYVRELVKAKSINLKSATTVAQLMILYHSLEFCGELYESNKLRRVLQALPKLDTMTLDHQGKFHWLIKIALGSQYDRKIALEMGLRSFERGLDKSNEFEFYEIEAHDVDKAHKLIDQIEDYMANADQYNYMYVDSQSQTMAFELQSAILMCIEDSKTLDWISDSLTDALVMSRDLGLVYREISNSIALAEIYRRKGELREGRKTLEEISELIERGPYRLFQVDALNLLTQIEIDDGNLELARELALRGYSSAWLDGASSDYREDYRYQWGSKLAQSNLLKINMKIPATKPFDVRFLRSPTRIDWQSVLSEFDS